MTWLIAEDEADIRNLIAAMCTIWGYQTIIFESGQKVWDWLDSVESQTFNGKMPDFVLMDIRMPGKKGNEVAHRMRTISRFSNIPIALMTAYSLSEAEKEVMLKRDGVDRIIAKPLPEFAELHSLLHQIIASKQN